MSETHYATGRRKTSTARVYLSKGKGQIIVNNKPLNEYFGREVAQMLVMQPLNLVELLEKIDINCCSGAIVRRFGKSSVGVP